MTGSNKTKSGTVLVYVLVMMSVSSIVLLSLMQYITSQIRFGYSRVEKDQSFHVAEAGIQYYRWYLAHGTSGKTAQQIQDFWDNDPLGVNAPYEADFEGIGKYSINVDPPSYGSTIVTVRSTGWTNKMPEIKRTIQVRFRRPSWSEYIFLSNSFINFGDQAEVYGKVHSNGGVRFDGLAHNVVSSLKATFDDPSYGGNRQEFGVHTTDNPADPGAPAYPWPAGTVPVRPDVFEAGREFPVPEVSFSGVTTDLANMKAQAQGGFGKYLENTGYGWRIKFKTDGTFDACVVEKANDNTHVISKYRRTGGTGTCDSCSGQCLANYPIPNNGIIFVENNAWVEGTINKRRVTVVAANLSGGGGQKDIYIGISNSNLRYAAYDCDNMLGLIAQRDVRVLGQCPDDFIVDAALIAQTGAVGINDNGFSGKNSLTFNGAIASYLQPYFVHGNGGFGVRTYNFNNNLLYCPPPYFPTGTEYSVDLWEEL